VSTLRLRFLLFGMALLLGGAIYGSARVQSSIADQRARDVARFDALRTELARADVALLQRGSSHDVQAGIPTMMKVRDTEVLAASALRSGEHGTWERRRAVALDRALARWTAELAQLVIGGSATPAQLATHARTTATLDALAADTRRDVDRAGRADQNRTTLLLILGALAVVVAAGVVLARTVGRRQERERRRGGRQTALRDGMDDFTGAMQLVASEQEAHTLLKRHLERSLDGADAVVLKRNNSDNRLEASTAAPRALEPTLHAALEPRDCLAVRAGQPYARTAGEEPLIACRVCGALDVDSTCQPLLVSGAVIGAVLVSHPEPLDDLDRRAVADAVTQAAPVLGNLRTLAIAEMRAATDALTGLSNRRALQDTLKRMVAQSQRTGEPLAALALDLDHFKQVNDRFGHEKGDEVLAAVGQVLTDALRESDFAARAGGEEFVVLLPGTDVEGAQLVADKLRKAVSRIDITGGERHVSASFGVAVHPLHAADAAALLRKADRALYAAKEAGRDRVEIAAAPAAESAPAFA
jgi:diguanylate cyclase (GGDEF)-like protein